MRRPTLVEKFWSHVNLTDDCWLWTGSTDDRGYGRFKIERDKWSVLAHKWIWEQENGPVPEGLELDHLCKTQGCVRIAHLEPVTHAENMRRHYENAPCQRGHNDDWYIQPDGHRRCRACIREYDKSYVRPNPDRDRENARLRQRRYAARKKAAQQRFEE